MTQHHKPVDRLPEPGRVVLICRRSGAMVIGSRNNHPLADSDDMSEQCHWNGCYLDMLGAQDCRNGIAFNISFQDGTVEWWTDFAVSI